MKDEFKRAQRMRMPPGLWPNEAHVPSGEARARMKREELDIELSAQLTTKQGEGS